MTIMVMGGSSVVIVMGGCSIVWRCSVGDNNVDEWLLDGDGDGDGDGWLLGCLAVLRR